MKYNVKASEELCNRWKDLENPFKHMMSIIQNDMEITQVELEKWMSEYVGTRDRFSKKLDKLYSETVEYVRSCQ